MGWYECLKLQKFRHGITIDGGHQGGNVARYLQLIIFGGCCSSNSHSTFGHVQIPPLCLKKKKKKGKKKQKTKKKKGKSGGGERGELRGGNLNRGVGFLKRMG